jgi:hypothetical protein
MDLRLLYSVRLILQVWLLKEGMLTGIGFLAVFLALYRLWVGYFLDFLLRARNTSFPNYLFKSALYRNMIKSALYGNLKTLLRLRNIFEPIHVVLCNFGGRNVAHRAIRSNHFLGTGHWR